MRQFASGLFVLDYVRSGTCGFFIHPLLSFFVSRKAVLFKISAVQNGVAGFTQVRC